MKKGFKSYNQYLKIDINQVKIDLNICTQLVKSLIENIHYNKSYTGLLTLTIKDNRGRIFSLTPSEAIKIHKDIHIDTLASIFYQYILMVESRYNIEYIFNIGFQYREWYKAEDYLQSLKDQKQFINDFLNLFLDKLNPNKIISDFVNFDFLHHPMYAPLLSLNCLDSFYENYSVIKYVTNGLTRFKVISRDILLYTWMEIYHKDGRIERIIPNKLSLIFKEGVIVQKNILNHSKSFKKILKDLVYNNKFGAIDFETINKDGVQLIYMCAVYVNNIYYRYSLDNYNNSTDMLFDFFKNLLENYPDYTFYAHNGSGFDFHFILETLHKLGSIDIIIKDDTNQIISINLTNQGNSIYLRDSYLMIPASLDKIVKDLKIGEKLYFPYGFLHIDNINYIGPTPDIKFYNDIPLDSYNKIKKENWNFKNELQTYLDNDVKILYETLKIFSTTIFNMFNINIVSSQTLASLSLKIYLSNFYEISFNIKNITGKMEDFIRQSYKGGSVNFYNNSFEGGFLLDINSSYPFAMLSDLPVGNGKFSDEKNLHNIFGFVEAEVTTSLKKRGIIGINDEKGELIFPTGTFKGVFYSEELKELLKYDPNCTINILNAVIFDKSNKLFNSYVKNLFEIKSTSTGVMKIIAKLLLNSLYGKFGMKNYETETKICTDKEVELLDKNKNIKWVIKISENINIVIYNKFMNENLDNNFKEPINKKYTHQSNVAISSAITALGRIHLNQLMQIAGLKIYYHDTDSIISDKLPPKELINNEIGGLKLEHQIINGIIISKKFYYLKCKDKNGKVYEVKKAKGLGGDQLNEKDYIDLLNGKTIIKNKVKFYKNLKNVQIINQKIEIKNRAPHNFSCR